MLHSGKLLLHPLQSLHILHVMVLPELHIIFQMWVTKVLYTYILIFNSPTDEGIIQYVSFIILAACIATFSKLWTPKSLVLQYKGPAINYTFALHLTSHGVIPHKFPLRLSSLYS